MLNFCRLKIEVCVVSNDKRLLKILEQIINIYIATGEPVGSAAVCNKLERSVSSATVRADMVKLEKLGLLDQPHVSSGRVPTNDGFRIYIKYLMEPEHLSVKEKKEINFRLKKDLSSVSAVVENALTVLSDFTKLATVSTMQMSNFSVISKVEVIPTGRRVYAILVITSTGEIKNRICRVEVDLTESQLNELKKLLNESLIGNTIESLSDDVIMNISAAIGGYVLSFSPLFKALREISYEMQKMKIILKGENNLVNYEGVQALEVLKFIATKENIKKVLSSAFSGINIIFGNESEFFQIGNSSLIVAQYGDSFRKLGCFGIIGPLRLDYKKVMAYVQYFERSVSKIIDKMEREQEDDELEG